MFKNTSVAITYVKQEKHLSNKKRFSNIFQNKKKLPKKLQPTNQKTVAIFYQNPSQAADVMAQDPAFAHGHHALRQIRHEGNGGDGQPDPIRGLAGHEDGQVAEDDQHDLNDSWG